MSAIVGVDGDANAEGGVDGDANERRPPRKRRRVACPDGGGCPEEGPPTLCFLIASKKKGARKLGRGVEEHQMSFQWKDVDSIAGALLVRWRHHATVDVRQLPRSAYARASQAQKELDGQMSGFLVDSVKEFARLEEWWRFAS